MPLQLDLNKIREKVFTKHQIPMPIAKDFNVTEVYIDPPYIVAKAQYRADPARCWVGVAKCNPRDEFNAHRGVSIAVSRVFKKCITQTCSTALGNVAEVNKDGTIAVKPCSQFDN